MKGVSSIDPADVLIVRGAETTDDLKLLGLPMAKRYDEADSVILVSSTDNARVVKGPSATVKFVDADARVEAVARTIERIYTAYQASHEPSDQHLAHAFVGMFLFYCIGGRSENAIRIIDLLREGDVEAFEVAAEAYIESGFSEHVLLFGTLASQNADTNGSRGDSPADPSSTSVLGDVGGGSQA